jgi:Zn-finger nucleic acid-binding protein
LSESDSRALKCPVCGAAMRTDRRNNVQIDVCDVHGIWLDAGELEAIVSSIQRRARIQSLAETRKARHDGKVQGAVWGFWSLIAD